MNIRDFNSIRKKKKITIKEIAEHVGVSKQAVKMWRHRGRVPKKWSEVLHEYFKKYK